MQLIVEVWAVCGADARRRADAARRCALLLSQLTPTLRTYANPCIAVFLGGFWRRISGC